MSTAPHPIPPSAREGRPDMEMWEVTTDSAVSLLRWDGRSREYKNVKIGGPRGVKRATITVEDREYYQSLIRDENQHLDPFTNGTLVQIVDGERVDEGLSEDGLKPFLEINDPDVFQEALRDLHSELAVRRLRALVEDEGKGRVWQAALVRDYIEDNFKNSKVQRTVREMDAGRQDGGERLYGE